MVHCMDHPIRPSLITPIHVPLMFYIPPHHLEVQNHPLEPSPSTLPHKRQLCQKGPKIFTQVPKFTISAPEFTSLTPKPPPNPTFYVSLPVSTPFHPLLPLTPPQIIHNTQFEKWVGHLWLYHNFDVEIFTIHPQGEEISLSGNFTFGTMIEFDYLSHHIGTITYSLGLYVEKLI